MHACLQVGQAGFLERLREVPAHARLPDELRIEVEDAMRSNFLHNVLFDRLIELTIALNELWALRSVFDDSL